ncbi:leucine-rich repeat domain-containing protein [bacterium]|nr:leucine-rich repeat domain-containing protein [bacterium]
MVTAIALEKDEKLRKIGESKLVVPSGRPVTGTALDYVLVNSQRRADTIDRLEIRSPVYNPVPFPLRNLTKVAIMHSGVTLMNSAFQESGLKYIELPNDVTLGDWTFSSCPMLESVTLPAGMTIIPDGTFYEDPKLRWVKIQSAMTALGDRCFAGCKNLVFSIPKTVQRIGSKAMYATANREVTIPSSCTHVGSLAFGKMNKLKRVVIENPDTEIAHDAFYGSPVESVQIGDRMYTTEYYGEIPFLLMSEPENVHGVDVTRIAHIGDHAHPDRHWYRASADGIASFGSDQAKAIKDVRARVMADYHREHIRQWKNASLDQRLNISLQEMCCANLTKKLAPGVSLESHNCDRCQQLRPAIYDECMNRYFKHTR